MSAVTKHEISEEPTVSTNLDVDHVEYIKQMQMPKILVTDLLNRDLSLTFSTSEHDFNNGGDCGTRCPQDQSTLNRRLGPHVSMTVINSMMKEEILPLIVIIRHWSHVLQVSSEIPARLV